MISKGSKPTFCAKQSSVNLGSMNAAPGCNSNSYTYSDRADEAECESLLEKDIQVIMHFCVIIGLWSLICVINYISHFSFTFALFCVIILYDLSAWESFLSFVYI